jgi:hypothetical protein
MLLRSLDIDLTLGQGHRPCGFGDIVRTLVEKDGHGEVRLGAMR